MRALLAALVATLGLASEAAAETFAITGATAWTMTSDQPVKNATIVVTDGKIVSVGAGAPAPAGARIVLAEGRIVTPGLMNAGTQLGLTEVASSPDTADQSVATGPLGAAFDVQYAINPNSSLIAVARADGLTRAMSFPDAAAGSPFAGQGVLLRLADGPDLVDKPKAALFATVGGSSAEKAGGSRSAQWLLIRNALDEAKVYKAAPRTGEPRDQLLNRLDVEALIPVVEGRTPLAIAAHRESDIRQAINLARDYQLRVMIIGGSEAWRAADALAAAKIPVIIDPMANLPMSFDEIGSRLDNAAMLNKAGVPIALSVPGWTIHLSYNAGSALREAAGLAVANGLPYAEALKALTIAPARMWGISHRYGTLEPGREADLVIWDGDPLEPISAPHQVFVAGKAASLATRQKALRDRYSPLNGTQPWPPGYR
ncbi:amidohydrolase family protein [Phenylobacterium sp.]|uniref:amidohydrolase family protein n=1 Tax=Phenylobacterium sp. TaxID=1871053 RepID=UPI002FCB3344